jgi:hypothetical protein
MRSRGSPVTALLASLFVVALATTLVLPGRQTPAVIREFFAGLAGATKAAIGQG